ncbi:hypothetical protein RIF29_14406 [Crotalaria pallida]|uniref:Uncharacterized protein n=1 Tax=Crotalaria pallida TaxID=3830 RepID=A0AAN9FB90_CROPI
MLLKLQMLYRRVLDGRPSSPAIIAGLDATPVGGTGENPSWMVRKEDVVVADLRRCGRVARSGGGSEKAG